MWKKKYLVVLPMVCISLLAAGCEKESESPSIPGNITTEEGKMESGKDSQTGEEKIEPGEDPETGDKMDSYEGTKEDQGETKNDGEETGNLITMQEKVLYEKNSLRTEQRADGWVMTNGRMRLEYGINTGMASVFTVNEEKPLLSKVYAKAGKKDGAEIISKELKRGENSIAVEEISDGFGEGMRISIVNEGEKVTLTQCYSFYEELPYFFFEAMLGTDEEEGISTNYIAPIFACEGDYSTNILNIEGEDVRFLFTPYDNDAFIRYSSVPITAAAESYEVTAIFDNTARRGMVVGSTTHDTWKTGIKAKQGGIDATIEFSVYGGASSAITRDSLPHGYVSGKTVASPKIFLGYYEDYRDGLEAYGRANAVIAPPLAWDKGIPMGWNSWSAVADKISYATYTDSSDFVKENLQENFNSDGVVYINFDSFWDNLTEKELKDAAEHVRKNGQIPGIYMTPFTYWGGGYTAGTVPGTNNQYSWQDIVLKDANGTILPAVDGGVSVDPTHPGTIMNIKYQLERFKEWGFSYVKMDFMSHGAREGIFYREDITTGTQAYNYGMQQIHEILAKELEKQEFFISFSIAPMFPSQYAHSRRISCDVFGTIDNTEYMLNSLTYGWWMNGTIYPFTDPDHIVLYNSFNHREAISYNEGLSRYISAAIAGTMLIDSDDYRIKEARRRAIEMLTCEEINAVAKDRIAFRPVEGNTKDAACDTFVRVDSQEDIYLAVFNFDGKKPKTMQINLERIGLEPSAEYELYDLWSKETILFAGSLEIKLEAAQPKLFRITKKK